MFRIDSGVVASRNLTTNQRLGEQKSRRDFRAAHQQLVLQSVFEGFLRTEEIVALGVALDGLDLLSCVERQNFIQALTQIENLLSMDLDIGGLSLETAHRLTDHH